MTSPQISVVIPAKDEAESLPELCAWIDRVMQQHRFTYEVILIDDGSTDNSWEVMCQIAAQNPSVKGIQFTRNYGKSAGLHVGFKRATGKVVITMDADLQDSPDEIPELYRMITEGNYDIVSGWKKKRYDNALTKNLPSKFYNWTTRRISGIHLHDFNCGLKAYRQQVIKSIDIYGEMHRYIPVIAKWAGFKRIGEKVVEHRPRKYGYSKFGIERFLFGFLDLLSISFVTRYRKRPMHFFGMLGSVSFLTGMIIALWLIGEKVYLSLYVHTKARDVTAQPLFFLGLVAIILGVQLFLAGFLGEMMITTNPQKASDYLVSDTVGL